MRASSSAIKNSMKGHLRNRKGYSREKTHELQKQLDKVDTYQKLQLQDCIQMMEKMQRKLSRFEENEKFNIVQANMYNDVLIKFNSLQYKYNLLL